MAKRRILKKKINYICSELFAECVALMHYKVDVKQDDVDNIMSRILIMQDEFISRISHTQKGSTKAFYKKLYKDLNEQVAEVVNSIEQLC